MKRLITVALACLILAAAAPVAYAGWGVGGFGGINTPIAQDDAENGTVFGVRGRFAGIWALTLEPQIFLLNHGDYDVLYDEGANLSETLESWKATSIGVNLLLGAPAGQFSGARPFFFGGVRLNSVEHADQDSKTKIGFGLGAGLEIGFGQFAVELRAGGEVFPDESASRKDALITGGVNLYLGP